MLLSFSNTIAYDEENNNHFLFIKKKTALIGWISSINKNLPEEQKNIIANQVIYRASEHDLPFELFVAVITIESRFDPMALSTTGAKGLTQVIEYWHQDKIKGRDIYDLKVNLEVGSNILKDCLKRKKKITKALYCYSGYSGDRAEYYVRIVTAKEKEFKQIS